MARIMLYVGHGTLHARTFKAEDVVLRGDIKEMESTAVTKDSATIK